VIDGSRITTGSIDADRIDVDNLRLPAISKSLIGTQCGSYPNNTMVLEKQGEVGAEPGLYQGYVRIAGYNGQVKTLSVVIADRPYSKTGTASNNLLSGVGNTYSNDPNTGNLPMTTGSNGVLYHSNRAEYWSGIARFTSQSAIAHIAVMFKKESSNSTPANLFLLAQGDGGTRQLFQVTWAFNRLANNRPDAFDLGTSIASGTGQLGTTYTSSTVTFQGDQFSSGSAQISQVTSLHHTWSYSKNGGSYVQVGTNGDTLNTSVAVSSGDTFTLRCVTHSTVRGADFVRVQVNEVSDFWGVSTNESSARRWRRWRRRRRIPELI